MTQAPAKSNYDVVIVGGAMLGASVAWFLMDNPGFDGSVLVVERDPSYEWAATSHTNSCMRQQFSAAINVQISQFGADYVKNFRDYMGGDPRIPPLRFHSFGYMYLANNTDFAATLRRNQQVQAQCGAGTQHMATAEIAAAYPFYNLDDIIAGNHNLVDEGYFDGNTLFDWWKRMARERGVEFIHNTVIAMHRNAAGTQVDSVILQSGEVVGCGTVVNASGPRAALTARMARITLPVEPRKRYTFIFEAETPLDQDLPLTIDPSGVHMRSDGTYYMAGCPPDDDRAVDYDDFIADHSLWESKVWPAIAHRIPQFAALRLHNSWVGHYDYNTLDQNAILGPHPEVGNFIFTNGFSGHGLQQSPAVGRGMAEWIASGAYQSLDLTPFHYDRINRAEPFTERAVI
ncbi:NAD(P)/FAD-dependent oxidoreductase [Loktanella agnita]|uniref:NAD(P)/FAD-dependent oxidoreductase n=1 Tax=Loktanella agnita TaxID=287097 RepID=UPI0039882ADE